MEEELVTDEIIEPNTGAVAAEAIIQAELDASINQANALMNKEEGFIYLITCHEEEKKYVGQTTDTIANRWYKHCAAGRRYIYHKDDNNATLARQGILRSHLYGAMAKFGVEKFEISELERCECETKKQLKEMLNSREIFWIEHYNSMHPNGYNLQQGGLANGKHAEVSIARISATKRANIENIRHPKLAGLPPYLAYRPPIRGEAIRIAHHPYCTHRTFSVTKYGSWDAAVKACLDYYNTLPPIPEISIDNDCDKVVSHDKRLVGGRHGAKYITKARNGWKVRIGKDSGSTVYFTDKTKSNQENYEIAVAYRDAKLLERVQTKLNVQRLDTNGVEEEYEVASREYPVSPIRATGDMYALNLSAPQLMQQTRLEEIKNNIMSDINARFMEIMSRNEYCDLLDLNPP